ncbi:MAG: 30S ribosomal protein S20 [Bacillota bacterium]|nr:30S ribosomal protein S20 [Bacillota bacterium]
MAKSKTPAKRALTAEKNRIRNKGNKTELKSAIKSFEISLNGDNAEVANEKLLHATSLIDKGVAKGLLHKNTAARKKSGLAKRFNAMGQ